MRPRALALCFAFSLLVPLEVAATEPPAALSASSRLVQLCHVWNAVRYLHPWIAYRDVDWDSALVRAIPRVESAVSRDDYVSALQSMLSLLGDAATHVMRPSQPSSLHASKTTYETLGNGVLLVHANDVDAFRSRQQYEELRAELAKAAAVVVDLRYPDDDVAGELRRILSLVEPDLVTTPVTSPPMRRLMQSGFKSQDMRWTPYFTAWLTELGTRFEPKAPNEKSRRLAFVVNAHTAIPPIALATQAAGSAVIVAEGDVTDENVVDQTAISAGEGIDVIVRTSEFARAGLRVDARVPATSTIDTDANAPALRAAVDLLRRKTARPPWAAAAPEGSWRRDNSYPEMQYPAREYRLLALFRVWGFVHYFYPYRDLLHEDWDALLEKFIPRIVGAADARQYTLVLAELATHIADGHTLMFGKQIDEYLGWARPPLHLRMIENKPIVTGVLDPQAGVRVGDEIVAVDDEPARARLERYGRYLAAATPNFHGFATVSRFLCGAEGSAVRLTVRGGDGVERRVTLKRSFDFQQHPPDSTAPIRWLDNGIGYADVRRLSSAEADRLFDQLAGARAIIFDLRADPRASEQVVVPRLNVRNAIVGARYDRPLLTGNLVDERYQFAQPIEHATKPKYAGRVIALVDERNLSHAEHYLVLMKAACPVTIVGSRSGGSDGEVTTLMLPGAIGLRTTGEGVRFADGTQLQRIGIVPDVEVLPTLAGIRAGRDEVLERALRFARDGR